MMFAKVILDSVNSKNIRLTSLHVRYPRFIHGEVMSHRAFSRNASSSRAIPILKMLKNVWDAPAAPVHWGTNKPGMQAGEELTGLRLYMSKSIWLFACMFACFFSWLLHKVGVHKQIANRITEPFQYIDVLITATDWDNFFALRDHPDAQPEIQELARRMKEAMAHSIPEYVSRTGWHLPFILPDEKESLHIDTLLKISTARCARISYLNFFGKKDIDKDIELYYNLVGSEPLHASPLEHQAQPLDRKHIPGNFRGWKQHRKFLEETNQLELELDE